MYGRVQYDPGEFSTREQKIPIARLAIAIHPMGRSGAPAIRAGVAGPLRTPVPAPGSGPLVRCLLGRWRTRGLRDLRPPVRTPQCELGELDLLVCENKIIFPLLRPIAPMYR